MSARDLLSRSNFRLVPRPEHTSSEEQANETEPAHVSAPVALAKVLHREQVSRRTGEAYALSAVVSGLLGVGRSLFVHHDIIPAGRRASGRHFHTERDEVVIVLEGEVSYVHAGVRRRARRGDAIGFPRGEDYAHAIENRTSKRAVVLVVANAAPGDVTIHVDADARSASGLVSITRGLTRGRTPAVRKSPKAPAPTKKRARLAKSAKTFRAK